MLPTTVDSTRITIDATGITVDQRGTPAIRDGWPCSLLAAVPPSVADKQSAPTADDLLPAVLTLTPRGSAWGTDEAGDGRGASPVMLRVWRAIAKWAADLNARDFEVATQAFPSGATIALGDWETELGLPDACTPGQRSTAERLAAVRTKYGAIGGSSPDYLICVAAALGYDITIEEPTQFLCDVSECADGGVSEGYFTCDDGRIDDPIENYTLMSASYSVGDEVAGGIEESYFCCDDGELGGDPIESIDADPTGTVWKYWIVHVAERDPTWFMIDEGDLGFTPLEGFRTAADLECVLRRDCPPHTEIVFSYTPAP